MRINKFFKLLFIGCLLLLLGFLIHYLFVFLAIGYFLGLILDLVFGEEKLNKNIYFPITKILNIRKQKSDELQKIRSEFSETRKPEQESGLNSLQEKSYKVRTSPDLKKPKRFFPCEEGILPETAVSETTPA